MCKYKKSLAIAYLVYCRGLDWICDYCRVGLKGYGIGVKCVNKFFFFLFYKKSQFY